MLGATGAMHRDFVEAMWKMLQQDDPDDYVVGTGVDHSVADLVNIAFSYLDLDPAEYIRQDPKFMRPAEVDLLIADPTEGPREARLEAQRRFRAAREGRWSMLTWRC